MTAASGRPGSYVFIVTYGRSGSTLLQTVLNSIPGYCIRGENGNALFQLFRGWREVVKLVTQGRRDADDCFYPSSAWYGADKLNPASYARALVDVFHDQVLQLPADTRVGGFKEIRWHQAGAQFAELMDFLHTQFPNAKTIINLRNHADVANSKWWRKLARDEVEAKLQKAEDLFSVYAAKYPDRTFVIRYEDYNGKPDGLIPLFDFLQEPFDRATIVRILMTRLLH